MLVRVPLSQLLVPAERWFSPAADAEYRQLGVRLWGQGAYERERLQGAQTKYGRLNRCCSGDIVVNKIWARNGSVAVVAPNLDGCVVSNEFPLFTVRAELLNPAWFQLFTLTSDLWKQCDLLARGTSGQNRIRPEQFLKVELPLPPPDEQRRIVAKVGAALAKLDEARRLSDAITADFDRLLIALAHRDDLTDEQKLAQGWRRVHLGEVMSLDLTPVPVDPSADYPNLGIYSFGRGLFPKPPITGLATSASTLYQVRQGQFIYSRLFAFEGSYGYVSEVFHDRFVSGEYPTFTCKPDRCRAEFV